MPPKIIRYQIMRRLIFKYNKKIIKKNMKTKYIKVSVNRDDKYTDYQKSNIGNEPYEYGAFIDGFEEAEKQYIKVPDREDEMREMLEEYVQAIENETIIVIENEDNDGWENFGGKFYDKAKQLLNK